MKLKIAVSQFNSQAGNLQENSKKILEDIKKARQQKADLIVFPELALSGQCQLSPSFASENKSLIEEIAKQTQNIAAIIGFVDNDKNAAAVIQNGKISVVHKIILKQDEPFKAAETTHPVSLTIQNQTIKVGILIGQDIVDQTTTKKPSRILRQQGAELLVAIGSFSYSKESLELRKLSAHYHADTNGIPMLFVNSVGLEQHGHHIVVLDGRSFFADKQGNLLELLSFCQEGLFFINTDTEKISKPLQVESQLNEKYIATIFGLQQYAKQSCFEKAVVALSGGIDSAVTLAIASEALGKQNVVALHMPSQHTKSSSKDAAQQLAKNLGVKLILDPITETTDCFVASYQRSHSQMKNPVVLQNLNARLRALKLLSYSNDNNVLIIGTANKTDIVLNNTTLFGDSTIGVLPLGDISKKEIYEFASMINKKKKIIPEQIIKAKPDSELGEKSEDQFNYDIVSPLVDLLLANESKASLMQRFKEKKLPCSNSIYNLKPQQFSKLIDELSERMHQYAYKHLQLPPMLTFTQRKRHFNLFDSWRD